jgi:hypothetical protein
MKERASGIQKLSYQRFVPGVDDLDGIPISEFTVCGGGSVR